MPRATPLAFLALALALIVLHLVSPKARQWVWKVLGVGGVLLFASGEYLAFTWAPTERDMGDVYRILFAHVPLLWMSLVALTINFGASIAYLLFKKSWVSDSLAEASAAVGLMLGATGVALGSIWAKPTWGVWWIWDPRLTSAAILLIIYTGYVALRKFIDDPDRRATWSAVVGIISYVDIPIIWFSVRWWKSIHQIQSSPQTVDADMTVVLRWNAVAMLCLMFVFLYQRYRLAMIDRERELVLPAA